MVDYVTSANILLGWIYRYQFSGFYGHASTTKGWKAFEDDPEMAAMLEAGALLLLFNVYWDAYIHHMTSKRSVRIPFGV